MSIEFAAGVLAAIIFTAFGYAVYIKVKTGSWPKIKSPIG